MMLFCNSFGLHQVHITGKPKHVVAKQDIKVTALTAQPEEV